MAGGGFDTPAVPQGLLRVIIVAWSSFAVAAIASLFFFATFDPVVLAEAATFPVEVSRFAGYTIGFLAFWLLSAASGFVSLFLIHSLELHPQQRQQQ